MQDVLGRHFDFAVPPSRVVSLVPSLTETLFALGAGESVVGISNFCIFPEGLALPRVGGTKNPKIEAIRALAPDLVHMNLEENRRRHAEAIEEFAPVFVTEPKSVGDVATMIAQLGEIHGRSDEAAGMIRELDAVKRAMSARAFTFAVPIWKDPWMWCGGDTYVSSLVETAGGTNVFASSKRYPAVSLDDALALRPDVVFLPDEPYVFTEADAQMICAPGKSTTRSVDQSTRGEADAGHKHARVIGPFPGHLFTWHGVRTIDGLKFLRDASL